MTYVPAADARTSDPSTALGASALHRIDKHEAVCAERWNALLRSNEAFHERLNAIGNRMWAAAIGLTVMALSAAGGLVGIVVLLLQQLPPR